ncbi:MAG: triose-phosphate isomerase [Candidatus Aenigmarchaeota archaeon]|nr:triose-phosphate isomerase [Candidatus Aenigmarchaeota archaeon]
MTPIKLIAQKVDIFPSDGKHQFARTGQLAFHHLKAAGAAGVLICHSEHEEPFEIIPRKLIPAIDAGLEDNIVLFGEKWEDIGKPWSLLDGKQKLKIAEILKNRLREILKEIGEETALKTVFSYEPGWAVRGSGKADVHPPGPEQIGPMAAAMRKAFEEEYSEEAANKIRIIYGGSMSPERAKDIMPLEDIDGFILGSAGTKVVWVKLISEAIVQSSEKKKTGRRPVLALNWKAYQLEEPYEEFLKIVRNYSDRIEFYLAPPATDLYRLHLLLQK